MPGFPELSNTLRLSHRDSVKDSLRLPSRSPHPYHRKSVQLSSSSALANDSGTSSPSATSPPCSRRHTDDDVHVPSRLNHSSQPANATDSDSGTEADDEHFLKGLPAPKQKKRKGWRNEDEPLSGTPSPLLSPKVFAGQGMRQTASQKQAVLTARNADAYRRAQKFNTERHREIRRRCAEVLLLGLVSYVVLSGESVRTVVAQWWKEIYSVSIIELCLLALYPIRLVGTMRVSGMQKRISTLQIPSSFDPAPILYPMVLPILTALLLAKYNPAAIMVNLVLGLASIPDALVPNYASTRINDIHWLVTCIPMFFLRSDDAIQAVRQNLDVLPLRSETMAGLYPLHKALCVTLHFLTTTSLLEGELQLLSIALINVLLLSHSPQAVIIKALLWVGGVGILVSCTQVLAWVVALARVPKWRFKRSVPSRQTVEFLKKGATNTILGSKRSSVVLSENSEESDELADVLVTPGTNGHAAKPVANGTGQPLEIDSSNGVVTDLVPDMGVSASRRHSFPVNTYAPTRSSTTTPSGRRKRSASSSIQGFFSLTESQAALRKWLYAAYVYLCVGIIILLGIRGFIGRFALHGEEPFGWALGYLFGNHQRFRMEVVSANLERWICLPSRDLLPPVETCQQGWVERLRQTTFGPANTRLLLLGYWLLVIATGLAIVFRLSAIYEVDTRRKVFHFMMVAMLFPATFVDPTYAALALSLVLAVFLLLDLFRATQLPPLSKPLAYFLTPYVDGRDLRGPVVISHIFLLVGCAIPLWLSLGALPRSGTGGAFQGWELPGRDISMISGVICVGLGDSAASLIGRRFGRHKWFWSGGKSIEGSVAFAIAVSSALVLGKLWLALGGWEDAGEALCLHVVCKCLAAATIASLTEAVLTGGNDNVVVPVVLWLCVKGFEI